LCNSKKPKVEIAALVKLDYMLETLQKLQATSTPPKKFAVKMPVNMEKISRKPFWMGILRD